MKKILKSRLFFFILGALIFGSISAVLAYSYVAGSIGFTPTEEGWDVENVQEALDSFRDIASHCPFGCPYAPGDVVYASGSINGEDLFSPECPGDYKLEVWGAQGGNAYNDNYQGGYGGYAVGTVELLAGSELYINVGGPGTNSTKGVAAGGYNGGGATYVVEDHANSFGSGGGATHIATSSGLLKTFENKTSEILIVAGGGGGAAYRFYNSSGYIYSSGGSGGGYIGGVSPDYVTPWPNIPTTGGTQSAGGIGGNVNSESGKTDGSFGQGATYTKTASPTGQAAGGGGYYGGGLGMYMYGGGGSGYIGNTLLSDKAMYCYSCTESDGNNINTISTYGTTTRASERNTTGCPNGYSSSPISKCAKSGGGYAKITYLG